jgi:hypothetical protein
MLLRVTIDIFSGRPNPVVELRDEEAREALKRLQPTKKLEGTDTVMTPSVFMLGYRGLIVEQMDEHSDTLPTSFRVVDGKLFGEKLSHLATDGSFEEYIAETVDLKRFSLGDDFRPRLKNEMVNTREARRNPSETSLIAIPPIFKGILEENKIAPCAPRYEPSWWNDGGQRQQHNNCYNYAANYRTDTFAQPGRAAEAMYGAITVDEVKKAAMADMLEDASAIGNNPPAEGHLVALVIAPSWDYHWYRMNRNCSWSHKPGSTEVTNLDNAGEKIRNPKNANRGPYTEFAGFMLVKHGHIMLK